MRSTVLTLVGICLLVGAIAIAALTFYPVVSQEISYRLKPQSSLRQVSLSGEKPDSLLPVDKEFGIVIPKIGANAKVVANVDPYDAKVYQRALTEGVAHAKGTAFPGQPGNIFIFSHSSATFFEASRYNSVFYLLSKMEQGDEIILAYREELYTYRITDKRIVASSDVSYLSGASPEPTLTLMTCWPPGTTFKRLIVRGQLEGI